MFDKSISQTRSVREKNEPQVGTTVISQDTKILGAIETTQNLKVEGTIEGDITCSKLVVAETGVINGDVLAESIESNGTINGTVKTELLRLTKTSKIDGGVILKNWIVDAGAKVNATCHFTDHPMHHENKDGKSEETQDAAKAAAKSDKQASNMDTNVVERAMEKKAS
ncbi:MAG: polymer-forming cytoskeletal protein [Alphaproteobacteria bacterium]|nr:MAG: polymer-forming cytoskeletal protein [Alphaproteobacteria bacterium]